MVLSFRQKEQEEGNMMTKRHFKALAEALKNVPRNSDTEENVWWKTVQAVAQVCFQFNERFDEERFYEAVKGSKPCRS